ncbi:MAG: efflux RND transporter periplasmic adaptor subunit [Rhodomicrobium sp.]
MLRNLLFGLIAVTAAAGALWYYASSAPKPSTAAAPPAIAVSVVPAAARDVPILLSGIGVVQALNTVQLRSRIDGTLDQVNFREGQQVKEGDVLAVIDPRLYQAALDQAKAKLAQDVAQLASDEKDLERSQQLSQQRFASQQSVDQLTAKAGVDKALIEADQALIRTAQTNLSYTKIAAPFPGRIGLRSLDPGNIVKANDTTAAIATLTQQNPIALVFTLAEANLGAVRDAQREGEVPVTALDQDGKKPIAKGKLAVIDNLVDQTTGTIRLKAIFDNEAEALWPGQYAPVQVEVGVLKGAVTAPSAAIQRGPNGLYVWRATPDKRAAQAPVEAGPSHEGATVVTKGLAEGDPIIVSNQYRLQPGARIEVKAQPVAANEAKARS